MLKLEGVEKAQKIDKSRIVQYQDLDNKKVDKGKKSFRAGRFADLPDDMF